MDKAKKAKKIAQLNDAFRQTFIAGRIVLTEGVCALADAEREAVIKKVRAYNDFHQYNDPDKTHGCGGFECQGISYFWQFNYYDKQTQDFDSPDPADSERTLRVLTISRTDEA